MFVGHFALGFAAKRIDPSVSLGTCLLAAQLPDVAWPALLLAGVERVTIAPGDTVVSPLRFDSYPYTHSLLAVVLWGALLAGIHFAWKRRARAAALLFGLVVSHWLLDFVTHRPDLPLWPGAVRRFGLGLWNSLAGTLVVELGMYLLALSLYAAATRARDRAGRFGFLSFAILLGILYGANLAGPPPPSPQAVAVAGLLGAATLLLWSFWFDRHRVAVAAG